MEFKGVAPRDPELDPRLEALQAEVEQEIEESRVNFRWGREQLDVVKRAAGIIGVPYQTYLKQVVYKQAVADIQASRTALTGTK